jgi:RNA polymerase sigma-70 factor (ECF subfamily)
MHLLRHTRHTADSPDDAVATPRMASSRDDQRLIALIRAGDEAAFETVFRLFAAPLCAFATHLVRSRELAADLVQDVFLNVWRNREQWQIRESLQAYLYRAVRNRALDTIARQDIHERWAAQSSLDSRADITPDTSRVDRDIDARDLTRALEEALALLPERRRQVFLLRWKEEMSYAEIAELLSISPRTVEVQMYRALRTLRAHLAAYLT